MGKEETPFGPGGLTMLLEVHPGIDHPEHIRMTHAGMAHFAQTGPANTWCKQCAFFSKKGCAKYAQLTRKKTLTFPADTPSCKYFDHKVKSNDPF
jgi:hypothetical protein